MSHNFNNSTEYHDFHPPEQENKRPLTSETIEWEPDLDTTLAINGRDILDFKEWINWNDADIDRVGARKGFHQGVDFAAYLTTNNEIVLGLPPGTPVRAVADGRVDEIGTLDAGYHGWISITHGKPESRMESLYRHVIESPDLKKHAEVKKGDIIGTLYIDEPREDGSGRLAHLHLELLNGAQTFAEAVLSKVEEKLVSPLDILDSSVRKYTAIPQQSVNFKVHGLENAPVKTANFKSVLVEERFKKAESK